MIPDLQLTEIAGLLSTGDIQACRVVTGFDGFVDQMISLVGERRTLDDFTPVPDISTFGALVSASAGHSSLREIVITSIDPGGCAVNLADGFASLGATVDCFATLGEPIHPVFAEIAAKCHGFHSWGREPGATHAFEFNDGKLMFSAVQQLADFTPAAVRDRLADGTFTAACAAARVIALTDWTLYPHMTAVWRLLLDEVFGKLTHRPGFFIDLVDPSGRMPADIVEVAGLLREFEAAGPLTLGLNGNETNILCRLHGLPVPGPTTTPEETLRQAAALRKRLDISRVIVHCIPYAVSAGPAGEFVQSGPYCATPKKSTGAGDRFNAGYCLGQALDLTDAQSLALGCASAGYYVRHASSATRDELVNFLRLWASGFPDTPIP
jgi:hypothetical protein